MEISNENLIHHANRLKEKTTDITDKSIKSENLQEEKTPRNLENNQNISAPEKKDSLNISSRMENNLSQHIRSLDVELKKIQSQFTENQQLLHSLQGIQEENKNLNGSAFLQMAKNEEPKLYEYLKKTNKESNFENADATKVNLQIKELTQEVKDTNESLYIEMKQRVSMSEVEMENMTASGLLEGSAKEDFAQLINNYRANVSLSVQEINPRNVDNLIS